MKILDHLNWNDLSVFRFLLLELSLDDFIKLALFIKFGHFDVNFLTVLIKWIFPLVWIVSAQELRKLRVNPLFNVLLSLLASNINFWGTIGETNDPDLSLEGL